MRTSTIESEKGMKFGVCIPNYGMTLSVDGICHVALEAERLGYDSIWTTDHILMPQESHTPYERIFDCLATLAFLAPKTKRVKLGISSLVIAMRNPAVVAKQLASIEAFSNGRVLLAMSAGWNEKEFSFLGSDFHSRGKRADESIKLIKSLWRGDSMFHSRTILQSYENAVFEPKPASNLTVWVGGTSTAAMKRAINLGDAWHPNVMPLDKFRETVGKFRSISPEAKNKQICVRIALNSKATKSEYVGPQGDRRVVLSGDMNMNKEIVSELEKLGVSYSLVVPDSDGKTVISDQLESIRFFAKEFL